MNADLPRRHLALAGLAAVVFSAAVGLVLLAYGRGDFDDTYELSAVFPTSSQGMFTDGGTEVKMRGINVGTVRGIELLPDGRVEVRFAIREDVRIPATAEARIEPLSVFGPKYVNMITHDTEADGATVPRGGELARATTGTDLTDEVSRGAAEADPGQALGRLLLRRLSPERGITVEESTGHPVRHQLGHVGAHRVRGRTGGEDGQADHRAAALPSSARTPSSSSSQAFSNFSTPSVSSAAVTSV